MLPQSSVDAQTKKLLIVFCYVLLTAEFARYSFNSNVLQETFNKENNKKIFSCITQLLDLCHTYHDHTLKNIDLCRSSDGNVSFVQRAILLIFCRLLVFVKWFVWAIRSYH